MGPSSTIFVTGATGNQGGAVARSLLNKGFTVKALTRNPASANALALQEQGAIIIKGDLNDPSTFREQLSGVEGIFSLQHFDKGIQKEIKQGIGMADLAKEYGIKHFLYTSVIGADHGTGIPHWESKNQIEQHIKSIGIPYTIIRPSSLMENLLLPAVKSRILKGKLVLPTNGNTVQQFISSKDIGAISTAIFMNPQGYLGKTISLASEQMDGFELARRFSSILGSPVKFQKLPGFITRLVMGRDLAKMFKWINENDALFVKDLDGFRKEFPGLEGVDEWIGRNFKIVISKQ